MRRTSTGSNNGNGKGGKQFPKKRKTPKKLPKQKTYEVMFKNSVPSATATTSSGGERENGKVLNKTRSYQDQVKKVHATGFLLYSQQ